jgi:hypothetical protein
MANSKKFVVKNGLETQNIQFVEQDGTETITLTVLDDGSLSFSGSSGQLFSIVDSLTGSIFSVNDISGIPSIEIFDDGKVILAESTGNVGIGTLTPSQKLDVVGNIAVSGTVDGRDVAADGSKLDGIEAGATADMTASEILTAIKTVDGASSGLDADLLDGQHGSYYAVDSTVVKVTGDQTIAGNKTFSNNLIVTGDLTVNGSTTNINTTNLVVEDKNIILGDVTTPSDTTADGGGITLKGATDKTITWVDSTDSWTFNQTIRHEGLNPSTGTNVDQLKSTTFTSALTTGWTDVTGVSGTYLATGSYIVQIESNGEYYTGNMSWFSGSTTTTTVDEIELHRAGPAASAARIYARVARVSSGTLKLQMSASTSLSSHTMTLKFRRTI